MSMIRILVVNLLLASNGGLCAQLDDVLNQVHPKIKKWASVCVIKGKGDERSFEWDHYRSSAEVNDFWPASTIKLYTAIAVLEEQKRLGLPLESTVTFERMVKGEWILDCARSVPEMMSEVFRRSSNEDYTLMLRVMGIDRLNKEFLVPSKGFNHSALMRGYVLHRPYLYNRDEDQRVTWSSNGEQVARSEHSWSGHSYSKDTGATIISEEIGNCTTTYEMADCLRRIMYHELIPETERFDLTDEQLEFLREGDNGMNGLKNIYKTSRAWKGVEKVFSGSVSYNKSGRISNYALDLACLKNPQTGMEVVMALAANTGEPSVIEDMAEAIAMKWKKDGTFVLLRNQ